MHQNLKMRKKKTYKTRFTRRRLSASSHVISLSKFQDGWISDVTVIFFWVFFQGLLCFYVQRKLEIDNLFVITRWFRLCIVGSVWKVYKICVYQVKQCFKGMSRHDRYHFSGMKLCYYYFFDEKTEWSQRVANWNDLLRPRLKCHESTINFETHKTRTRNTLLTSYTSLDKRQ